MITYQWKITSLDYYPHLNGFDKVVCGIHWILVGVDDTGPGHSVSGIQKLITTDLDPNKYIVFEDLTQEQVIIWLEESMGPELIQDYKNKIQEKIDVAINVTKITSNPPWI